jgi:methyl-accepting chemotaxis protein
VREQTKAASHVVALMERVQQSADQISVAGTEQDKGNEIVYRSALTMREVAQQVRSTTEDQARGFGRIRENVDGVRDAVEQIAGALREQSGACGEVTRFLEQVFEGTRTSDGEAGKMRDAMRDLVLQAERLREDAERFRV